MQIPIKTLKNGFAMPVFGLGTWQMGGGHWQADKSDDPKHIQAIQYAIEQGITHIDTAEMYGAGHAEELVAEAINDFDRTKLFLVTKVSPSNHKHDAVIKHCHDSLKRLRIDYVDLYLLHAPNLQIPLAETMQALDYLVGEGSVKNIGVSNFSAERMAEAQKHTKNSIFATQVHYNLIYREPQRGPVPTETEGERGGVLQYCQDTDAFLIAWRPVEKGALTHDGNSLMDEMCKKYAKTPAQIAINWLISQQNVVTLAKMSSKDHIDENLGALGWEMTADDIEKLTNDFPGQKDVSNTARLT